MHWVRNPHNEVWNSGHRMHSLIDQKFFGCSSCSEPSEEPSKERSVIGRPLMAINLFAAIRCSAETSSLKALLKKNFGRLLCQTHAVLLTSSDCRFERKSEREIYSQMQLKERNRFSCVHLSKRCRPDTVSTERTLNFEEKEKLKMKVWEKRERDDLVRKMWRR